VRILINSLNFAPEPTGCGKYTSEMAEWLAARGHEVEVICAPPHYPWWSVREPYRAGAFSSEVWRGVVVWRTPLWVPDVRRVTSVKRILMESSFAAGSLRYWLEKFMRRRHDVCIAICPPLQASLLPLAYAKLRGVPWVLHVQDLQVDAAVDLGMLPSGVGRSLLALEARILSQASLVSSISEPMLSRLIAKGVAPERAVLLPNWADVDVLQPRSTNTEYRRELGIGANDFVVMYAGAMGEKQGLDLVVEAARGLDHYSDIHFVFVGSGPAKAGLQAAVTAHGMPRFHFADVQPAERLEEVLCTGDVHLVVQQPEVSDLVMPSKIGNILAVGRTFVASAREGSAVAQVAHASLAGRVVPPGDAGAMAHAIVATRDGRDTLPAQGLAGRAYAVGNLSRNDLLLPFENALRRLVSTSFSPSTRSAA